MQDKTCIYLDGRPYQADPLECSISQLAARLDNGSPVSVTLEPGDATRYELLLVPMWAPEVGLHNWGIEDRQSGLVVTRLVGGEVDGGSCIVLLNRQHSHGLWTISRENTWTFNLFTRWFSLLAAELRAERGEDNQPKETHVVTSS